MSCAFCSLLVPSLLYPDFSELFALLFPKLVESGFSNFEDFLLILPKLFCESETFPLFDLSLLFWDLILSLLKLEFLEFLWYFTAELFALWSLIASCLRESSSMKFLVFFSLIISLSTRVAFFLVISAS